MKEFRLVTELPGKIKIYQNLRNWVLQVGGVNNRFYFPELDHLCDELLNLRLKVKAAESKRIKTDLRLLINAVENAREAVRKDIDRLQKIVTRRDSGARQGVFEEETHG